MSIELLAAALGRTTAEIVRQADGHTRSVQAWLSSRAPGAARYEGIGVKASSTGLPIPLLNLALSAGYPPGTPEETIVGEIETVKAFFTKRNVPWYWWLGHSLLPGNLPELLEQNGLTLDLPLLPAMVALLPSRKVTDHPDIEVWPAATHADLEAASRIRHTAFRFPAGAGLDYFEAMSADWLGSDTARLFLARKEGGPPSAIGALVMGDGLPGVYVMATLPEWRQRGLGKAILSRILSEGASDGHPMIILTASRMGFPLYQQFGFEHAFDYRIYRPV